MKDLMDKKYQTYKWNIEVNLQKEAVKNKAIRKCYYSESTKAEVINMSSSTDEERENNQASRQLKKAAEDDEAEIEII